MKKEEYLRVKKRIQAEIVKKLEKEKRLAMDIYNIGEKM